AVLDIRIGKTAGRINQGAIPGKTDAAAHGAEILHAGAEVIVERADPVQRDRHDIRISANIDIGDVGFQAPPPVRRELPVVPSLAAADEAVAIETNLSRARP